MKISWISTLVIFCLSSSLHAVQPVEESPTEKALKKKAQHFGYSSLKAAQKDLPLFLNLAFVKSEKDFDQKSCQSKIPKRLCELAQSYYDKELKKRLQKKKDKAKRREKRKKRAPILVKKSSALQKEDFQSLVQRFPSLSTQKYKLFQAKAQKTRSCPRNLSLVLAYKMKQSARTKEDWKNVKELFEHGRSCIKRTDPWHEFLYMHYGLIALKEKNTPQALEFLKEALNTSKSREDYRILFWLWKIAVQKKNLINEALYGNKIIKKYPRSWYAINVWRHRGQKPVQIFQERKALNRAFWTSHDGLNYEIFWALLSLYAHKTPPYQSNFLDAFIARNYKSLPSENVLYLTKALENKRLYRHQITLATRHFVKKPDRMNVDVLRHLHPIAYKQAFKTRNNGLSIPLIMGLSRQESSFQKNIVSPVGARGLMQILPSTARRHYGVRKKHLSQTLTNVNVGTKYLKKVRNMFKGSTEKALAAYNAGPGRIRGWEKTYGADTEISLFLDLMPYRETREYVPSILRNAYWYRNLYPELHQNGSTSSKLLENLLVSKNDHGPQKSQR